MLIVSHKNKSSVRSRWGLSCRKPLRKRVPRATKPQPLASYHPPVHPSITSSVLCELQEMNWSSGRQGGCIGWREWPPAVCWFLIAFSSDSVCTLSHPSSIFQCLYDFCTNEAFDIQALQEFILSCGGEKAAVQPSI